VTRTIGGDSEVILVCGPELIAEILVDKPDAYRRDPARGGRFRR
jgi:hypothetical protein